MDTKSYEKGMIEGQDVILSQLLLMIEEGAYLESVEQWAIQQQEWLNERQQND